MSNLAGNIDGLAAFLKGLWDSAISEVIKYLLMITGCWEIVKVIRKYIFKRRTTLEELVDNLTEDNRDKSRKIDELNTALRAATEQLPATAIAKAERDWRDGSEDSAIRYLEDWFAKNSEEIASIALYIAKYHISHAVPDPKDHLHKATGMLRLAREASPENREARELQSEFDIINAGLQEQLLRSGADQIVWNSGMASGMREGGDAVIPLLRTCSDIARYCFDEGRWRLAPLFADRAAAIARTGGRVLKPDWLTAETRAAWCWNFAGASAADTLRRIDRAIAAAVKGAEAALKENDLRVIDARHLRADVLRSLGRYDDVLAEIDAFAPIKAEILGARHPSVLATRFLRAAVLYSLGRYDDALAEIDAFAPIQVEVLGPRHPDVLATRALRADVRSGLGRYDDALAEIDAFAPIQAEVQGARHPSVLLTRYLRAEVLGSLGRYGDALAEIDAFAPIQVEVLGPRHPNVLTTQALRADVRSGLGRYDDALAEIDAFAPIIAEVLGPRHPDVLATRRLRAEVLSLLGRYDDALAEIDAFAPIQAEVRGARHPSVLLTRYLRAEVLGSLGRYGDALAEIDASAPIQVEVLGARHPNVLATKSLRIGIGIAAKDHTDWTDELRELIDGFALVSPRTRRTLAARYRLARLLSQKGDAADAKSEITEVLNAFDPSTDPAHELLRAAKALLDRIEGRPTDEPLIP